jgi:hypothetical protein
LFFFHGHDRDLSFAASEAGYRCVVVDAVRRVGRDSFSDRASFLRCGLMAGAVKG